MIPWWWAPVAWVIGELMGFLTIIICMGSGEKTKEQERKQMEQVGLLFPEKATVRALTKEEHRELHGIKKAADAGTSTADRETVRKGYFL